MKKKRKEKPINLQKEEKTTGEINITIQINKKITKKKPSDGTPSLQFAASFRWAGFAASRLIRVCHLATQRTWYKQFVQLCLLAVASCPPS